MIALAVGLVLSANSRLVAHDFSELAKIVADHHDEISEHGHAHEDIVDVMHAYLDPYALTLDMNPMLPVSLR